MLSRPRESFVNSIAKRAERSPNGGEPRLASADHLTMDSLAARDAAGL
jgi:hypothetical protein